MWDTEVSEIISYYLNNDTNILEVSFRTSDDPDDVVRIDNIDFSLTEEYGFEIVQDEYEFFNEDEEEDVDAELLEVELDNDDLITFLNEYYLSNPESLPDAQIF
jgi:hypothetical protein